MSAGQALRPARRRHHRRRTRRPGARGGARRRRPRDRGHLRGVAGQPRPGRGDAARRADPRDPGCDRAQRTRRARRAGRRIAGPGVRTRGGRRLAARPARAAHRTGRGGVRAGPGDGGRRDPAGVASGHVLHRHEHRPRPTAAGVLRGDRADPGAADRHGAGGGDGRRAGAHRGGRPCRLRGSGRHGDDVLPLDRRPGRRAAGRHRGRSRPGRCSRRWCAPRWRSRWPVRRLRPIPSIWPNWRTNDAGCGHHRAGARPGRGRPGRGRARSLSSPRWVHCTPDTSRSRGGPARSPTSWSCRFSSTRCSSGRARTWSGTRGCWRPTFARSRRSRSRGCSRRRSPSCTRPRRIRRSSATAARG